jgi:hypothetical protein
LREIRSTPDQVKPLRPTPMPYRSAAERQIKKGVRRVDDDGAGRLFARIRHDLALQRRGKFVPRIRLSDLWRRLTKRSRLSKQGAVALKPPAKERLRRCGRSERRNEKRNQRRTGQSRPRSLRQIDARHQRNSEFRVPPIIGRWK